MIDDIIVQIYQISKNMHKYGDMMQNIKYISGFKNLLRIIFELF